MAAVRVLVVKPIQHRHVRRRRASAGRLAVDVADNGIDGLELAQGTAYDAAVIDVMLPRLDGLSLVAALRRASVSTPVLFLSRATPWTTV